MIKVDKDIEMPRKGSARPSIYPWREMEVGDSFFVPKKKNLSPSKQIIEGGFRFHQRRLLENGIWGVRVWRVE